LIGCSQIFSRKIKKLLQLRASNESIISHVKNDYKMGRIYLKGVLGDTINPILAATIFNFLKYVRL
jgi:IS5 family transposase